MRRALDDAQLEQARLLYVATPETTVPQVAKQIGVNQETLYGWFRRRGWIKSRKPHSSRRVPKKKKTESGTTFEKWSKDAKVSASGQAVPILCDCGEKATWIARFDLGESRDKRGTLALCNICKREFK